MSMKSRRAILDEMAKLPKETPFILLATGSLAGEGFDCPVLDALVISLPISWETRLEQYVGRLLHRSAGKLDAIVLDIVNEDFPFFRNMWKNRRDEYKKRGFDFENVTQPKLIGVEATPYASFTDPDYIR